MTETIDGVVVTDKIITSQSEKPSMISMVVAVIPVFLVSNIPTLIFLAIYFACREKLKLRNELDDCGWDMVANNGETGQFCPSAKLALILCIALEKKFEELFYFN